MRVWLLGASGMLGRAVCKSLEARNEPFISTDRYVDITNEASLLEWANFQKPKLIINCAAYTKVDDAEDNEAEAYAVNAKGVETLGRIASSIGASVLHVSTDYVFPGNELWHPYQEEDETGPKSAYGRTKLAGEKLLLEACPRSWIVRTSWLFGEGGRNFVQTMLQQMRVRKELNVVYDQRGRPTYTKDLADAFLDLAGVGADSPAPFGIYHFANEGDVSWFEFAVEILRAAEASGLKLATKRIFPVSSDEFPQKATRPAWSVLDTAKVAATLKRHPRPHEDALNEYIRNAINHDLSQSNPRLLQSSAHSAHHDRGAYATHHLGRAEHASHVLALSRIFESDPRREDD